MRPTGHQTITNDDNRKTSGRAFRNAREGDTYIDAQGKHWLCQGDFVKPSVFTHKEKVLTAEAELKALLTDTANDYDETGWKAERGIPANVDVKYPGSFTQRVAHNLIAECGCVPAVRDAVDLLRQYHRDLHVPYTQRDEARKERDELKARILGFVDGMVDQANDIVTKL